MITAIMSIIYSRVTKTLIKIIGRRKVKRYLGETLVNLMSIGLINKVAAPTMTLAIPTVINSVKQRVVCSIKSLGPGWMPIITKAAKRMIISELPGIPKASVVNKSPEGEALLAVVDATMPSGEPLPNSSGCFEVFFACP